MSSIAVDVLNGCFYGSSFGLAAASSLGYKPCSCAGQAIYLGSFMVAGAAGGVAVSLSKKISPVVKGAFVGGGFGLSLATWASRTVMPLSPQSSLTSTIEICSLGLGAICGGLYAKNALPNKPNKEHAL